MTISLLLMMLIPIVGTALLVVFTPPRIKYFSLVACVVGMLVVAAAFGISYGTAVHDTEVWSGKVIGKDRKHGTYEESYSCNCKTVTKSSGSGSNHRTWTETECETCYRTHYTVSWLCDTTIGPFKIHELDELDRSVYSAPDPQRWTSITIGDPVADTRSYVNYVQAVKNSLFTAADEASLATFSKLIPAYPDRIYDIYKVDRFVTPGFAFTDAAQWNEDISKMLVDLGPQKQVNVIVVIAKTDDRAYTSALRTKWEGANKNDVVLVIGSTDGQKMNFVDAITWSKNEIFKVQLIDRVQSIGIISRPQIMDVLQSQIAKNFERRRMREFEYLKGEIDPSSTTIAITLAVLVVGYGACIMIVTGKLDAFINRHGTRRRF